jgi:DNA-binding transcriptional LysR family regulator
MFVMPSVSGHVDQKYKTCRIYVLESPVMELHQLEYFVAVAEEGSFTRAAERVHVAQPGVSAQVRRLEQELGHALFDRSARTVRLTEVGEAVLPWARAALDAVTNVRLAVDELAGVVHGHVRVGMVSGCASPIVPQLLAGFHGAHPGVDITLVEADSDRLVELLQEGRLDLALIGSAGDPIAGIETGVVADEELVAAVAPDDRLARRKTVTLEALRDRALIALPKGTGVRSVIDRACAAAGFEPRVAFEAIALPVLAHLARQGLGVAVVPESTVDPRDAELVALPITGPRLRARLELAWSAAATGNPATRTLVRHARDALDRLNAERQPAA